MITIFLILLLCAVVGLLIYGVKGDPASVSFWLPRSQRHEATREGPVIMYGALVMLLTVAVLSSVFGVPDGANTSSSPTPVTSETDSPTSPQAAQDTESSPDQTSSAPSESGDESTQKQVSDEPETTTGSSTDSNSNGEGFWSAGEAKQLAGNHWPLGSGTSQEKYAAWTVCTNNIDKDLRKQNRYVTKFSPEEETQNTIKPLGNGKEFIIKGWVDIENEVNIKAKYYFKCSISVKDDRSWTVLERETQPRPFITSSGSTQVPSNDSSDEASSSYSGLDSKDSADDTSEPSSETESPTPDNKSPRAEIDGTWIRNVQGETRRLIIGNDETPGEFTFKVNDRVTFECNWVSTGKNSPEDTQPAKIRVSCVGDSEYGPDDTLLDPRMLEQTYNVRCLTSGELVLENDVGLVPFSAAKSSPDATGTCEVSDEAPTLPNPTIMGTWERSVDGETRTLSFEHNPSSGEERVVFQTTEKKLVEWGGGVECAWKDPKATQAETFPEPSDHPTYVQIRCPFNLGNKDELERVSAAFNPDMYKQTFKIEKLTHSQLILRGMTEKSNLGTIKFERESDAY